MMVRICLLLKLFLGIFLLKAATAEIEIKIDEHWDTFKKLYNKSYTKDEDSKRMAIFDENVALISKHNLENDVELHSYRLAINKYTDLSKDEFNELFNRYEMETNSTGCTLAKTWSCSCDVPVPDQVDYRNVKMVTSVKDQEGCGDGYAFAALGALEALWKKKTGELASLSSEEIKECSTEEGNKGCDGGSILKTFKYIIQNKGVDRVIPYPFKNKANPCSDENKEYRSSFEDYKILPCGDEEALKKAVAFHGPVAVAVDAHLPEFQQYNSGIFNPPGCNHKPNHAMLVVGYGTEDGVDYWLLKNSYGKSWGQDGYMQMARNKDNQCGISTFAVYPIK